MNAHELNTELQKIKPESAAAESVLINDSYSLFEIEEQYIQNAVPKRRKEFASGRAAARAAFKQLGIPPQAIIRASDRRPIWPEGTIGSISHSKGYAAALVTRIGDIAGLGLDIEDSAPLKNNLLDFILTPQERKDKSLQPIVKGLPRCKAIFVAKEALFKAIYPITKQFFGFQDARVEIHENGRWDAYLLNLDIKLPRHLIIRSGRWSSAEGLIIAAISVDKNLSSIFAVGDPVNWNHVAPLSNKSTVMR
jgi:4'-phosphopantetheinyl transferase EntD